MITLDDIDTIHDRLTLNNIAQRAEAYKLKTKTIASSVPREIFRLSDDKLTVE